MPASSKSIVKRYTPQKAAELCGRAGDRLVYERRPSRFEGWIWCTDAAGVSAWVPEAWAEINSGGCRLLRDYSSRELDVEPGDQVYIEDQVSGWAWVRSKLRQAGWVPLYCIELDSSC